MQSSTTLCNIFHSYKLTYVKSLFSVFMLKYSIHSDSYYYKFNTNRWNLNELVYVHIFMSFRYLRGMWDSCQPIKYLAMQRTHVCCTCSSSFFSVTWCFGFCMDLHGSFNFILNTCTSLPSKAFSYICFFEVNMLLKKRRWI